MFHDDKLKSIENEYKDNIESYHLRLDRISSDIRNLEKLLHNAGVGDFEIEISPHKHLGFSGGRIRYLDLDVHPNFIKSRPLIEQRATIRIEVAPYLPDLFEACMSLIKKEVKKP